MIKYLERILIMDSKKRTHNRRIRDNIMHFKNTNIDYRKLVGDFYIENGLAYISCNVRGIWDIVHPYSVRGYEILNRQFSDFIDENAYHIPVEYPIVLEICGVKFSENQQAVIEKAVSDFYALRLADSEFDLLRNKKKSVFLLLMGILSIAVTFALQFFHITSSAFLEPLIFLIWFFVWEFGDIAWFERRDLINDKIEAAQMASMKVIFREQFKDVPYDEETSKKILEEILESN